MRIVGLIAMIVLTGCSVNRATERSSGVGFGTSTAPAAAAPVASGPTDYRGQLMQDMAEG